MENKRITFARIYFNQGCQDGCGAYIKAYNCDNKNTAKVNASRLLKHPEVIAEIAKMQELSKEIISHELQETKKTIANINLDVNLNNSYIQEQIKNLECNAERLSFLLDANNRKKILADIICYNNQETIQTLEDGSITKKRRNNKLVLNGIDILNKMDGIYSDKMDININIYTALEEISNKIKDVN